MPIWGEVGTAESSPAAEGVEVEVAWPRRAGSSEPAAGAAAAAGADEEEGVDESEVVGEESPEREAGDCAALDIRVCARVWRKEGGEQREEEEGVGWIGCGGGGCGSMCVVEGELIRAICL
jgi:hypothetical protein